MSAAIATNPLWYTFEKASLVTLFQEGSNFWL